MEEKNEKLQILKDLFIDLVTSRRVSESVMREILCGLNDYGIPIPRTVSCLLQKNNNNIIRGVSIDGGTLLCLGIERNLEKLDYDFFKDTGKIIMDLSWDGVPLFGSSSKELWPITGTFVNQRVSPILISCFVGNGKPKNPGEFFYSVMEEVKTLRSEGVLVGPNQDYKEFEVRAFLADAPAREWAKGILSHGGYESCDYCDQTCTRINNSMVYQSVVGNLRTNQSFRNRDDKRHNKYDTIFTDYDFINLIDQFPPDPMHLIDEGAGCAILMHLNDKLVKQKKAILNDNLAKINKFIPSDMARQTRTLKDLKFFKATEFRSFLLYIGPVALLNAIPDDMYEHFLLLHYSYRLLSMEDINHKIPEENIRKAEFLIKKFVQDYPSFYGPTSLTYNIHILLHVCYFVRLYGPLHSFSCFPNENFYQTVGKWVQKGSNIDVQISNCWNATSTAKTKSKFNSFIYTTKSPNNFVQLKNGNVMKIVEIEKQGNDVVYKGIMFQEFTNLYSNNYFQSKDIDIFIVNAQSQIENIIIHQTDIKTKMMSLPYDENFIVIPILHYNIDN